MKSKSGLPDKIKSNYFLVSPQDAGLVKLYHKMVI